MVNENRKYTCPKCLQGNKIYANYETFVGNNELNLREMPLIEKPKSLG